MNPSAPTTPSARSGAAQPSATRLYTGHCVLTGHSRGLGAALCQQLLDQGWRVLAIARQVVTSLTADTSESLQQVALNLADSHALLDWLNGPTLCNFLQQSDRAVLINNAGVVHPIGAAGQADPQALARCLTLNTTSPIVLGNAWLAQTAHCRDRRLLHISSGAARSAYAGWSAYGASKAALDHHARCVAADAPAHLRVASLAPGVIDTDMQGDVRMADAGGFPMKQRFIDLKAQGQLTPPAQAAHAIVNYLLSDAFGADPCPDIRQISPR